MDAIVVGNVGLLKTQLEIDARLIDPDNGKAVSAAGVAARDENRLREAVNNLAAKFAAEAGKIPVTRDDLKK